MKKSSVKRSRKQAARRGSTAARKSPKNVNRNRENAAGLSSLPRHQTFDVNLDDDASTDFEFAPVTVEKESD